MSRPIQIRMGGYGPATTGFSKSLKFIGDRLTQQFGDRIEVKYVWNIMDFGYRAEDILWLVESGVLYAGLTQARVRFSHIADDDRDVLECTIVRPQIGGHWTAFRRQELRQLDRLVSEP